jgi:hypothetical protein
MPGFARVPSTHLALLRGSPLVIFEEGGAKINTLPGAASDDVAGAISAYLARPFAPRRLVVSRWNDAPVLGGPGEPLLRALGFQSTPNAMEWWAGR